MLDLGCSIGHITNAIAEKANHVVGIDHDTKTIEEAERLYKRNNLQFINQDALKFLNENREKFGVLILSHLLEHIDDPKEFLLKFKDHFKSIYIEVPDFDRYYLNHYRKDAELNLIYSDEDHVSEFDRDELKNLLAECNIEIVAAEYRYGVQKLWCAVKN